MDEQALLAGRVKELSLKTYQNEFVTHTGFLTASEQAQFRKILRSQGIQDEVHRLNGAAYTLYGGFEDAERRVICFLPSWTDEESFLAGEKAAPEIVSCVHVRPANPKFADELTHRDFLGALMNLGIERDRTGDILTDGQSAYICILKENSEYICRELTRVRHTTVVTKEVLPGACTIVPSFRELEENVMSERLDCILAAVYRMSRSEVKEMIDREEVIVDGASAYSGGYDLSPGARVSVKGRGKFIYEGQTGTSRKGRLFVKVKIYN